MQVLSSCFIDHPDVTWCLAGGHITGSTWSGGIQFYNEKLPSAKDATGVNVSQTYTWDSSEYGCINAVSWSPALNDSVVCGNLDGDLMTVSVSKIKGKAASNKCVDHLYKHNDSIESIDCFQNTPFIVSGNSLGQVALFDIKDTRTIHKWCHSKRILKVSASRANDKLFASSSYDGTMYLWDSAVVKHAIQLNSKISGRDSTVGSISFHHKDENIVALGYINGIVRVYDLRNPDSFTSEIKVATSSVNVAFSPHKTEQLVITSDDPSVFVVDINDSNAQIYSNSTHKDHIKSVAWNLRSDEFITTSWDGVILCHTI